MLKFAYNIRSWCYWVMIQELWKTPNNRYFQLLIFNICWAQFEVIVRQMLIVQSPQMYYNENKK